MFNSMGKILRMLRKINCFSGHTEATEYSESIVNIPNYPQDKPITAGNAGSSSRQESKSTTPEKSSHTALELAIPVPSIDDRATIRGPERADDAGSESQTIKPRKSGEYVEHVREGTELQQESAPDQPRITFQSPEVIERYEEDAELECKETEKITTQIEDNVQENNQKGRGTRKPLVEAGNQLAESSVHTAEKWQDKTLNSTAALTATSISPEKSLNLSPLPSGPVAGETSSSRPGLEGAATSSTLSPWDGYSHSFPNQRPASMPPPERLAMAQTGSPSERHRRHQSELSTEQTQGVLSVVKAQAVGQAPLMMLKAQRSNNSLSTTSSGSVGADWHHTIVHLEYKSEEGGNPVFFQAKLDTAARRDVIAEDIVKRVGMKWKPDPKGKTFNVIGTNTVITPLGYVVLSLRVVGREDDLQLKFYVIADSDVGHAFDCLLSVSTTMKHFLGLRNVAEESSTEDPRDE